MTWKLIETIPIECTLDDSGVYCVVNRIRTPGDVNLSKLVRVDVMSSDDEPLISFIGPAEDVRKHVIGWIREIGPSHISSEHASYIGAEITRAALTPGYVQDADDKCPGGFPADEPCPNCGGC